ncbi:SMP-30/gluconolactonase/LRE family protein [Undibacterium sp. Jales W-56]|uniref:SMP-30/gluconolactonase/LRE family protein n=1 Tax=Undibacterium sp. Jales W-56 TaxID=2897325 RepID=UPI0021D02E21|nr:SMP-30/gluconolactonase/LRE family protein [Undibacterium sp. Jales W-56]MCU6434050.1 SMP-30/gluconolactonase/LRE family protein [Undibacterium sp. Jales W-56]
MLKKILTRGTIGLFLLLLAVLAYLLFAPVAIQPVAWQAPPYTGYTGAHARNHELSGLQVISLGNESGPEHILPGPDGKLYAAVASGAILRMQPDGSQLDTWMSMGERVLGFAFDARGRMIVAMPSRGLLMIDQDKKVSDLVTQVNQVPVQFVDAVVVAQNGKIYFTDATQRFGVNAFGGVLNASMLDFLEHSCTGRVLEYDPASAGTRVLADGFCFSNGIALSQDEQHLFVSETAGYRVWKLSILADKLQLQNPPNPQLASVVLDNLPGFPDNLMRGTDGKLWVGIVKPRSADFDKMSVKPWLRSLVLRLPRSMWKVPQDYGHVIAFDETGKVLKDMQDPSGAYPETSGVTETADRLYLQSLRARSIAWLAKK